MILQALVKHYEYLAEEGKAEQPGWCKAKVSYAVNLSKDGQILGILSLKKKEERGKKEVWTSSSIRVPEMVTRSSDVLSNFLCDNAKFILGIDKDGINQGSLERFQAAKEKHLLLLQETKGEMAQSVRSFFETWKPEKASECAEIREKWEDITDGGNLIFCMGIHFAQDDSFIRESWEKGRNESAEDGETGICLVTGEKTEISRIHKDIKGIPGTQSRGAKLISFNESAFESYGKVQSYNAPVGKYAEFAYTTALNYLLEQKKYTFQLGDSMIIYWAESAGEEYQAAFFEIVEPGADNQEEIRGIFENLKKNRPVSIGNITLNSEQRFYILSLAPNAARLAVRFFYQDSFGNILRNLSAHYERMSMIRPSWENKEFLGVRDMLSETVNQNSKNKSPIPNMAAMVLQSVLSGSRYPTSIYTDVLIRIRAEQGKVTWGRAGIIKAYLIRNGNWKEGGNYMGLNEESKEKAYVLGRLFSVLESIQMDTNPGIKATIRDRYFNSACATPASIFPVLIKLKNSHMKKLERDKGNAKICYEKLLTDLMEKLDEYPRRLSLEEQGKFILGYYHQMQKKYEKKGEK